MRSRQSHAAIRAGSPSAARASAPSAARASAPSAARACATSAARASAPSVNVPVASAQDEARLPPAPGATSAAKTQKAVPLPVRIDKAREEKRLEATHTRAAIGHQLGAGFRRWARWRQLRQREAERRRKLAAARQEAAARTRRAWRQLATGLYERRRRREKRQIKAVAPASAAAVLLWLLAAPVSSGVAAQLAGFTDAAILAAAALPLACILTAWATPAVAALNEDEHLHRLDPTLRPARDSCGWVLQRAAASLVQLLLGAAAAAEVWLLYADSPATVAACLLGGAAAAVMLGDALWWLVVEVRAVRERAHRRAHRACLSLHTLHTLHTLRTRWPLGAHPPPASPPSRRSTSLLRCPSSLWRAGVAVPRTRSRRRARAHLQIRGLSRGGCARQRTPRMRRRRRLPPPLRPRERARQPPRVVHRVRRLQPGSGGAPPSLHFAESRHLSPSIAGSPRRPRRRYDGFGAGHRRRARAR